MVQHPEVTNFCMSASSHTFNIYVFISHQAKKSKASTSSVLTVYGTKVEKETKKRDLYNFTNFTYKLTILIVQYMLVYPETHRDRRPCTTTCQGC
jgi:hypothetical protein